MRRHAPSNRAVVTLSDCRTGRRRDVYLGPWGSDEARRRYDETMSRWLADGRVLDGYAPRPALTPPQETVAALVLDYWRFECRSRGWDPTGRLPGTGYELRGALRVLRSVAGATPAHEFGPLALQQARDAMIDAGWNRTTINKAVRRVVAAFRWAVAQERLPADSATALTCVRPLQRGERAVPEGKRVEPVPPEDVEAVLAEVSGPIAGLIRFQLLTAARAGEAVRLRGADIDRSRDVWVYRPTEHKTAYRGHERRVYIGPECQKVLAPFLARRDPKRPLFSPLEAEAEFRAARRRARRTPESCGNRPGTNRTYAPQRRPREAYTVDTYGRAIRRACERLGIPVWGPARLRHNAATELRRRFGAEAVPLMLGHSSPALVEVYAERDEARARRTASVFG